MVLYGFARRGDVNGFDLVSGEGVARADCEQSLQRDLGRAMGSKALHRDFAHEEGAAVETLDQLSGVIMIAEDLQKSGLAFQNGVSPIEVTLFRTALVAVGMLAIALVLREKIRFPTGLSRVFWLQAFSTLVISVGFLGAVAFIPVSLTILIFYTFVSKEPPSLDNNMNTNMSNLAYAPGWYDDLTSKDRDQALLGTLINTVDNNSDPNYSFEKNVLNLAIHAP